jgi:exonuclease SbcD
MYRRLYAYADAQRNPGEAIVALGHLHATGAELSDDDRSERAIMGGLESVSADTFDAGIAYTALGHIHKAQRIGGYVTPEARFPCRSRRRITGIK